jgi:hypothetical protein
VVLSGAETPATLRSNLGALELQPSSALLGELEGLREEPINYWRARAELLWN